MSGKIPPFDIIRLQGVLDMKRIAALFLLLLMLIVPLGLVWYVAGSRGISILGGVGLIIFGLGFVLIPFAFLIDAAVSGKDKALKIAEFINGVCRLLLLFVGLYVVITGIERLWAENRKVSIAAASALVFVFYYWVKKKEAEEERRKKNISS